MKSFGFRVPGFHRLWQAFPDLSADLGFYYFTGKPRSCPTTPHELLHAVWALPTSLAATMGISLDFFSCRYLDGSLPCVSLPCTLDSCIGSLSSRQSGYPIRKSGDRGILAPTPGFSQLITSFFAWQLLGILRRPFFA